MAVTNINVSQDNITSGVNLMAVHSPLVFLIDVTYTGAAPTLYCDVTIDGISPISDDAVFQCVFLQDLTPTVRRFIFRADSILRGYMEDFEDYVQTDGLAQKVMKTQQAFILVFHDTPVTHTDTVEMVAFAAVRQYGQTPAITDIYANQDNLYIAGALMPVYVHFFNPTSGSTAHITDGTNTYTLGTGAEDPINTEPMTTWQGTGNHTSPANWFLYSNKPDAVDWRLYENPADEGTWILHGASLGDYHGIARPDINWEKGEEVYLRLTYKGSGSGIFICALEKAEYAWTENVGLGVALPYSANYTTKVVRFRSLNADWVKPGPRMPYIALLMLPAQNADVNVNTIEIFKPASQVGYYRLKLVDLEADTEYKLMDGVTELAKKTVRVKPFCTGYRYLKYLGHNGQYRFYPFNDRWQSKDTPKLIGKVNQLVTNLFSDQGESKNVGYTNERKLTLTADDVLADELVLLSDIYTSPRVYLYVGAGTTDLASDWVRVTVSAGDSLVRRRKGTTSKVELTVTLPEWYNITML